MQRTLEDCIFTVIGATLSQEELYAIGEDPVKLSRYFTRIMMFSEGMYELISLMTDKEKLAEKAKEIKQQMAEMSAEEILKRFVGGKPN